MHYTVEACRVLFLNNRYEIGGKNGWKLSREIYPHYFKKSCCITAQCYFVLTTGEASEVRRRSEYLLASCWLSSEVCVFLWKWSVMLLNNQVWSGDNLDGIQVKEAYQESSLRNILSIFIFSCWLLFKSALCMYWDHRTYLVCTVVSTCLFRALPHWVATLYCLNLKMPIERNCNYVNEECTGTAGTSMPGLLWMWLL